MYCSLLEPPDLDHSPHEKHDRHGQLSRSRSSDDCSFILQAPTMIQDRCSNLVGSGIRSSCKSTPTHDRLYSAHELEILDLCPECEKNGGPHDEELQQKGPTASSHSPLPQVPPGAVVVSRGLLQRWIFLCYTWFLG